MKRLLKEHDQLVRQILEIGLDDDRSVPLFERLLALKDEIRSR